MPYFNYIIRVYRRFAFYLKIVIRGITDSDYFVKTVTGATTNRRTST